MSLLIAPTRERHYDVFRTEIDMRLTPKLISEYTSNSNFWQIVKTMKMIKIIKIIETMKMKQITEETNTCSKSTIEKGLVSL